MAFYFSICIYYEVTKLYIECVFIYNFFFIYFVNIYSVRVKNIKNELRFLFCLCTVELFEFLINLISRYEAPIDTVHQLAEKQLEWGATHDAWIFSILLATEVSEIFIYIHSKVCIAVDYYYCSYICIFNNTVLWY